MINIKILNDFKNMKISKKDLYDSLGDNLVTLIINNPVVIESKDLIKMLHTYKNGDISIEKVLDWVNIIWFTELFDYNEDENDSIASIMNKLEELDEDGQILTSEGIDIYIQALENNQEI